MAAVKADALIAYVTFDTQLGYLKCEEYGRKSSHSVALMDGFLCFKSQRLQLKGEPVRGRVAFNWPVGESHLFPGGAPAASCKPSVALVLVLSMAGCSYLQTVRDEAQRKEMMESRGCLSKMMMIPPSRR